MANIQQKFNGKHNMQNSCSVLTACHFLYFAQLRRQWVKMSWQHGAPIFSLAGLQVSHTHSSFMEHSNTVKLKIFKTNLFSLIFCAAPYYDHPTTKFIKTVNTKVKQYTYERRTLLLRFYRHVVIRMLSVLKGICIYQDTPVRKLAISPSILFGF